MVVLKISFEDTKKVVLKNNFFETQPFLVGMKIFRYYVLRV